MTKNLILILSILTLFGCGQQESETEKQNFKNGMSLSHLMLISNILEKDIELTESNIPAKKSILVVEKRNDEIIPYSNLNSFLEDRGYNIAYDSNLLDYIIVIKFEWIPTGSYSNGSEAYDCKTLVYAIDTKTENISLVESKTIVAPEKVSARKRDGHYGGIKYPVSKLADIIIDKTLK